MIIRSFGCLTFYLCFYILLVEGFGGLARAGSFSGLKSIKYSGSKKNADNRSDIESKPIIEGDYKSSRDVGRSYLSAWGIISLIMLVIVGSVLIYYVSIFYPLVCAERGKYDVMEMTTV